MSIIKGNSNKEIKIIEFEIQNQSFGIEIFSISSVIELPEITKLPKTPDFIEGIVNIRGAIIPILDLKKRFFDYSQNEVFDKKKALIINVDDSEIGIIVDKVLGVKTIPDFQIENSDIIKSMGIELNFIECVAKFEGKLVIILKCSSILSISETKILKNI